MKNLSSLKSWVIRNILRPKFVVSQNNEFGVEIWGIVCVYYKRSDPLIYDGYQLYRPVTKREFGEYIYGDFKKHYGSNTEVTRGGGADVE